MLLALKGVTRQSSLYRDCKTICPFHSVMHSYRNLPQSILPISAYINPTTEESLTGVAFLTGDIQYAILHFVSNRCSCGVDKL